MLGANKPSCSKRIVTEAIGNPYIEFELIKTHEGQKGYILFHIDRLQGESDQVACALTTSAAIGHTFAASKLRGGQRILLPEEMTSLILSELGLSQTVQLAIGGHKLRISPEGFSKAIKNLNISEPWFKLPNIAMDWSTN